jgi:hypothetical protein
MNKFNKKNLITLAIIIAALILVGGGIYYYATKGQGGQKEKLVDNENTYKNEQYGFKINFPDSWKGYTVTEDTWVGWPIDRSIENEEGYQGPKLIFRNPEWTSQKNWQDIPIMIFTPDVWDLIVKGKLIVSSSPILPEKIGENSDLVFATPPRWTFNGDPGAEEAIEIVKTFRTFKISLEE